MERLNGRSGILNKPLKMTTGSNWGRIANSGGNEQNE